MSDDLHVLPVNDLVMHEENSDCVCIPESVPVKLEDGSIGWYYVHHALDGRE